MGHRGPAHPAAAHRNGASPAHAQRGDDRARCGAPCPIARASRADERHQQLVGRALNAVRAGDDANGRCWAGIALRAGRPSCAGRTSRALRSGLAALAGRPRRSLAARLTLRPLWTDCSLRTGRAGFAALTGSALRANRPLRSLCALRSGRTDGAGLAGRARWALRPWLRFAASRDRECREDGGDHQVSSHRPAPSGAGRLH